MHETLILLFLKNAYMST